MSLSRKIFCVLIWYNGRKKAKGSDGVNLYRRMKQAAAALALIFCSASAAAAADTQLAAVQGEINGAPARVELWGEMLPGNYADKLMLFFKDARGQLLSAFEPSVTGGYNCLLRLVSLDGRNQQVLLAAGRGGVRAGTEFRIVDFTVPKKVQEVFAAAANHGVIDKVSLRGGELRVLFQNGEERTVELAEEDCRRIAESGRPLEYEGLFSLLPCDIDGDGRDELLSLQKISLGGRELAEAGALWRLDAGQGWLQQDYALLAAYGEAGAVNKGATTAKYTVLPRAALLPRGEAALPVIACRDHPGLQNRLNAALEQAFAPYLQQYCRGESELAFQIMRATENMLTFAIISGREKFTRHYLHLDPQTGREITLQDCFRVRREFRRLLASLNENEAMDFSGGVPQEWYIRDDCLYVQQMVDGEEQMAAFALKDLQNCLKSEKFVNNKN